MHNIKLITAFLAGIMAWYGSANSLQAQSRSQSINAIIGDESYYELYHTAPDAETDEKVRIQIHLAYVETLLRERSAAHLGAQQQQNRAYILDLLHEYWLAAQFPTNRDYPGERRPCFIDADGNICAVGYLLAETEGRDAAESINRKYQYDYLSDMNEPALEEWAAGYGLSLEECAMIQPTYGPPPPPQTSYVDLKPGYGIPSSILGGANLATNIAILSGKASGSKGWSYAGLAGGGAQLILGLTNIKRSQYMPGINGYDTYVRYRAQNNVSYLNIVMGTATLVTSSANLIMQSKRKDRRAPVSLYSYPNEMNSISMGLYMTYRL